ncbi:type VI secretion system Vgr family protein, partial [Paraherbaspirillum soli]
MRGLPQALLALIQNKQHARVLRLSFPNDDHPAPAMVVNRLQAREELSRDFEYVLEILADDARIPLKELQGKMAVVELVRADGSTRYFSGVVASFRLVKSNGGIAFYEMILRPWLWYLTLRKNNFLFHGKTLREQTEIIFKNYGAHANWDSRVKAADIPVTEACQFDESDSNYLHRRWEDAGWHYWYEHDDKGHKLILSDDSTYAAPIDGSNPEIRFQRHAGAQEENAIHAWSPVRDIVPGQVALSSFNFKYPVPSNVNIPTLNKQGDVLNIESYEYTGAYGYKNDEDGDKQARLRMEEIETSGKHIEAAGNNRDVQPGRWFRLTDHFSNSVFGQSAERGKHEYLVVSVVHTASNNYLQQADEVTDYSNRLSCIRKSIPWRPGRGYHSVATKIHGPQT